MSEMRRTLTFAGVAAVLAVLALVTAPRQKAPEAFFDQGEAFFPDFTDPNAARTLEVPGRQVDDPVALQLSRRRQGPAGEDGGGSDRHHEG